MKEISPELRDKLKKARLLALDSDGVLTDGGVYANEEGGEFRRFNIKDGLGLHRLVAKGFPVTIISQSKNKAVIHRAHQLGISDVFVGVEDKVNKLKEVCDTYGIGLEEVGYIGDDLADLPVIQVVGFSCAPADAASEIKECVDYVCQHQGGNGAVREVCELVFSIKHI